MEISRIVYRARKPASIWQNQVAHYLRNNFLSPKARWQIPKLGLTFQVVDAGMDVQPKEVKFDAILRHRAANLSEMVEAVLDHLAQEVSHCLTKGQEALISMYSLEKEGFPDSMVIDIKVRPLTI